MADQQKKDPFVPVFFLIGALLLGAAVFILVSNLLSTVERNSVKGAEDNSRQVAVANESLKPIGNVTTTATVPKGSVAPTGGSGGGDGEAIYKTTCFACHGTGAANAPMITKKDQWAPRVANGLPALIETAIKGKGAMPAKGGNPALTDAEIKAAILYMTKEAGFDLGDKEEPAKESAPAKTDADVTADKSTAMTPATVSDEASAKEPAVAPVAPTKTDAKESTTSATTNEPVPTKTLAPAPMDASTNADAVAKIPMKAEPTAPAKPAPVAEPQKPETPATPAIPNAPIAPVTKKDAKAPKEAIATTDTAPTAASSKTHEVKMLNTGKDGMMVFEPATLQIAVGDTVKFIPTDGGHNAASLFTPEGGTTWKGEINQEVSVTIKKEGVYIYSCDPHKTLAMVGVIQAGKATNKEAAVAAAKEISASFAMNKDRLEKYLSTLDTK
jgi:pseudoazurin